MGADGLYVEVFHRPNARRVSFEKIGDSLYMYECTDSTDDMWSITYEGEPIYNTGNRAERKNKLPPKEWGKGQLAATGTPPVPSVSYITDFRMWSAITWSSEVGPQPQTGSSPILALIEQIT